MAEKEAKASKSELLRAKIYKHAIELFNSRGFENVKVSDICEAADISTGAFYYHFPSKEAIFLEYIRIADETINELAARSEYGSQAERLKMLVTQKVHVFSVMGKDLSNACLSAVLKHTDDSFIDIHRSAYAHFMQAIELGKHNGEFRSDIDTYTTTCSLRYVVDGLALHWASTKEDFDIDAEAEKFVNEFIGIIKAK